MFTKILVCADGTDRGVAAARAGALLARDLKAELTLLHVCQLPMLRESFPGAPTLAMDVLTDYTQKLYRAVWDRTLPAIKELGVACQLLEEAGEPAQIIPFVAETQGFDLIILGSRGMSTQRAAQFGSVSYGVVHRAHCPVLLVKASLESNFQEAS